jgi:hypothetical protein
VNFEYTKVIDFPKHQKRERILPWVRFGIFNPDDKDKILYPLGLVDSGSDVTIVNHEFGENLGYSIEKGVKDQIVGFGGAKVPVFFHPVGFYIYDGSKEKPIIYQDFVAFSKGKFPSSMPQQTAILGTIGLFRHLKVTFEFPKQISVALL